MDKEAIRAAVQATAEQVFSAAGEIYHDMLIPIIKGKIAELHAPGGQIHSSVVGDSVALAAAWYGMYPKPKVYHRLGTFTDEDNIAVSVGDIDTDGRTFWSAEGNVAHLSPHAGFANGFPMKNGIFRPGGPIVVQGGSYNADVDIDPSETQGLWDVAVSRAINMIS